MKPFLMSFLIALGVTMLITLFWPAPAYPQSLPCGNRDDFIKTLADKYNETSRAMGIANRINVVEIFVSAKGTWTIMVTQPTGLTCIIAAGVGYTPSPPGIAGDPA
jgi:hypothetical protein